MTEDIARLLMTIFPGAFQIGTSASKPVISYFRWIPSVWGKSEATRQYVGAS
jgi:hypothetical protein